MSGALKRFKPEDVQEILGRAIKSDAQGDLSLEDLRATAAELGISPQALDTALEEHSEVQRYELARAEYVHLRKQRLGRSFAVYLATNAGLASLNLAISGGLSWAPIAAAGWGIGMLVSAARTWFMTEEDIDHGATKLLVSRQKRERKLLKG